MTGSGISFTHENGTDVVVAAVYALRWIAIGKRLNKDIYSRFGDFWCELRWVRFHKLIQTKTLWLDFDSALTRFFRFQFGQERDVPYLAAVAIVNALWDLWAKIENKPLWKLLTDMEPEVIVCRIPFHATLVDMFVCCLFPAIKKNCCDKRSMWKREMAQNEIWLYVAIYFRTQFKFG